MPDELDELRRMARAPEHYSSYALSGALHTALDRLGAAERERDELRAALRQAEQERDTILALSQWLS